MSVVKHYLILHRFFKNTLTVPIKAVRNEFDSSPQFCGGFPAMFGGTAIGDADKTLRKELHEESRSTIELENDAELHHFSLRKVEDEKGQDVMMNFYWTTDWRFSDVTWQTAASHESGEMARIVRVTLDQFSSEDAPNVILEKLLIACNAPRFGLNAFLESETARAYVEFILGCAADRDEQEESQEAAPDEVEDITEEWRRKLRVSNEQ